MPIIQLENQRVSDMEKLPKERKQILVCIIILPIYLQHTSLVSSATPSSTDQTQYFISCGSTKDTNYTNRVFVKDSNSGSFRYGRKGSTSLGISNQQSNVSELYQTARIFSQPNSYYVFDISNQGITHILRLHFFPFPSSSTEDLSSAVFDVSVPGLTLLRNFNVPSSANTTTVMEFMLTINSTKFVVYFNPKSSSFAFVNAIEVFIAPDNLIPDSAPNVSTLGNSSYYSGILSQVLQTKYRLNVGGLDIDSSADILWRTWKQADKYMTSDANASKDTQNDFPPIYSEEVPDYIAPAFVYQTAREMATNFTKNITWGFNVTMNTRHMVRAHFCDFLSPAIAKMFFNLYIFDNFSQNIDPYGIYGIDRGQVPFKFEFAVLSDAFGKINLGIGSLNDSITPNAYLNGLEIWEIMGDWNLIFKFNEDEGRHSHVAIIVGAVVGGFVLLCILVFAAITVLKYRKPKRTATLDWSPLPALGFGGGSFHSKTTDPTVNGPSLPHIQLGLKLPLLEIQSATNNFDESLKVGEGGFGNVYRGTLRNGEIVAVKRSRPGAGQGLLEFHTEITVLSKIRHRHLVSLIGYCAEKNEMILVYEFMEKGSLRDHLYNNSKFLPLSWKQRLEICIGAARGFNYLHKGAAGGIIHRDVKSTNILLDANFVAKVADFGLSKSGPLDQNQTHVSTGVKGTFGYLDPEYFKTQQLTEKSDVYSFGVVLLEVLCARPAIIPTLPREQANLAEWGMLCIQEGTLEKIVDPTLSGQINPNSLRKFSEIAEKCLQEEDEDRPTMGDVLWDLEYALQLQQTEVQRQLNMESALDHSSIITLTNMQRFPSFSMSFVGGDANAVLSTTDSSDMSRSEVFSMLKIDEPR